MKRFARLLLCSLAATLLTAASGYQVNYGANQDITEWSTCKNVANASPTGKAIFVPTNTSTEWAAFYNASTPGITVTTCPPPCGGSFAVSSNASNINLFNIAGSPTCSNGTWTITINSSVAVYATATGTAALVTGSWPSGSNVVLINNGTIYGKGGNGSAGANTPTAGGAGGPAISLAANLTIDNTNGYIYGGGGGGGGGSRGQNAYSAGGGGGGGRSGLSSSSGGAGQSTMGGTGTSGGAGTTSGGGVGGAGYYNGNRGGKGGNGGDYGTAGGAGGKGDWALSSNEVPGGAGGGAGKAIQLNGKTVTFTGGNNSTQVKGPVS